MKTDTEPLCFGTYDVKFWRCPNCYWCRSCQIETDERQLTDTEVE